MKLLLSPTSNPHELKQSHSQEKTDQITLEIETWFFKASLNRQSRNEDHLLQVQFLCVVVFSSNLKKNLVSS